MFSLLSNLKLFILIKTEISINWAVPYSHIWLWHWVNSPITYLRPFSLLYIYKIYKFKEKKILINAFDRVTSFFKYLFCLEVPSVCVNKILTVLFSSLGLFFSCLFSALNQIVFYCIWLIGIEIKSWWLLSFH